jgi:hypothetical protein
MNRIKEKNTAMIAISAVILLAANLGIWMAAKEGAIAPVSNSGLWGGFLVLNAISIMWAIVLLGLQPMVVSLSYVAGGFLAYKGVEGLSGISVAEVTTAGATYGAFGALAVGNLTAKVRLAFYNKKQVPFIFVIVGLLVLDAVLNSGISSAGGRVILNAMVFPFVLAGVIFGLIWTVLNHFGVGYNPREALGSEEAEADLELEVQDTHEHENALKIEVPESIKDMESVPDESMEPVYETEEPQLPSEKEPAVPAAALEADDEEFFPLEIDNNDELALPLEETYFHAETDADFGSDEDPYSVPRFDSTLYASGAMEDLQGAVIIEEPVVSETLEQTEEPLPLKEEAAPVVEEESTPQPSDSEEHVEPEKQEESGDWLSGHLDLLNKLK